MTILPKYFYDDETLLLAKNLLGKYLVHDTSEGRSVGKIVETEAYLGIKDPASHGFGGESKRTKAMFGEPGHAYIYFTYGMYYCFNVTSAPKGVGEGVLIRALEPVEGFDLMIKRRSISQNNQKNIIKNLCNGPAKLVIAMGIKKSDYGHDLTLPPLFIAKTDDNETLEIMTTTRVGINQAKDLPYRFYIKDNSFISRL